MATKNASACGLKNWAKLTGKADEPTTRVVYDPQGVALKLGERDEKASGGEGVVYAYPANPNILVKIYKANKLANPAKKAEIAARLRAMLANQACVKMPGLAWPLMPVFDAEKNMIGFVMRACKGVPFQSLFAGPKSVQAKFPNWTRRELALTALAFVKRCHELAEAGVLVNDFNPANFLVDEQCNVSFIDTDSYQLCDSRGKAYLAHTHFPSHTAPELLTDQSSLQRPRTIEQVRFSAAILAFQLLMCGYHPYSYYDSATGGVVGTPDENLVAGRCPLGLGADCRLPEGWYRLWSWLSGKLKNSFIETFRFGHRDRSRRTSLGQLAYTLQGFIFETERANCPDAAMRRSLSPATAKPHEYLGTPRPAYPNRGFLSRSPRQQRSPFPQFCGSSPQRHVPPCNGFDPYCC